MVSRRRILSRSRDDLNLPDVPPPPPIPDEEDIWYSKEKLFKDHIQEVVDKWEQIDDEIWGKVIVFERNRRVAKAYARAPVLTVNGNDNGFDGLHIGLNGFDNPMRDSKTEEILNHIGSGMKVKVDDNGNILIKRLSRNPIFLQPTGNQNALSPLITKLPNGSLELDKPFKLFDMQKFTSNVSKELGSAYPDRRKLEMQCITAVSFVKQETDLIKSPCWLIIINLVAMEILKARISPIKSITRPLAQTPGGDTSIPIGTTGISNGSSNGNNNNINNNINNNNNNTIPSPQDIRNRPKIPLPKEAEDDPYTSVGGIKTTRGPTLISSSSSTDKPPKLPPRDLNIPKPDYDDSMDQMEPMIKPFLNSSRAKDKADSKDRKYDDPYYCGLRARIPAFVQKALPSSTNRKLAKAIPLSQSQQQPQQPYHHHGGMLPQPPTTNGLLVVAQQPPPIPSHHLIVGGGSMHHHHQLHGLPPPRFGPMPPHWKSVDSGMASIHSNPYADPISIRKCNMDKYSWSHTFESESDLSESIYAPIYGRLPLPMRNPNTFTPSNRVYVGEWE